MMTCDELRKILKDRNVGFREKPTQNGTRFDCATGETFNVFESGKMSFQRKQETALAKEVKSLYEGSVVDLVPERPIGAVPAPVVARVARPVFIVYGHDLPARDQLELILRRMGLEPVILGNLAAAGDTIIEKLV